MEKQISGNCNPLKSTIKQNPKTTKDSNQREIENLVEDMVARVEEKAIFEEKMNKKISGMRAKLRSSKDVVQLFQTERIGK